MGATPDSSLARAEELFFKGIAATRASDWTGALDFFQASRRLAPTWESTMNAAFCLEKLTRYDEALEMYEGLLGSFSNQLEAAERIKVVRAVAALQRKIARIEVTTNLAAQIMIDGQLRGSSTGSGRTLLRVLAGTHHVQILKDGFDPIDRTIEFAEGASVILYAALEASIPPPPPPARPYYFITAFAGYAISGSLGSTAETGTKVISHAPVHGFVGGLRGGHRFASGVALEFSLGYLTAVSSFHRNLSEPTFFDEGKRTVSYDLAHDLRLNGTFFGAGVSYRIALNDQFDFVARSTVGLLGAHSTDSVAGRVCRTPKCDHGAVELSISGNDQSLESTSGLIMPAIELDAKWRSFRAGVSLGVVILTSNGPNFRGRKAGVTPTSCKPTSTDVQLDCVPNKPLWETESENDIVSHDVSYGIFTTLWIPQAVVGYSF
jgi:tetratricopeptide (TPR) repeat protein